jgi:hypothetical protein
LETGKKPGLFHKKGGLWRMFRVLEPAKLGEKGFGIMGL